MDYAELKETIADWLMRQDLNAVIPSWIKLAEARFNRELRTQQMVVRAQATLEPGQQYVTVPGDWLEAWNIQVNGDTPRRLTYMTLEAADELKRRGRQSSGEPRHFNVTGSQFEVIPVPQNETDIELAYFAKIPALSNQNPTNWLLEQWPDAYLYGALAHSAPYLKDDQRVATWAAFYDRMVEEIRLSEERARYSGSVLKVRTPQHF